MNCKNDYNLRTYLDKVKSSLTVIFIFWGSMLLDMKLVWCSDYLTFYAMILGVTIGFEEPLYIVEEPSSGTVAQQVCLLIRQGNLGRNLQVVPEWREDTAQGM